MTDVPIQLQCHGDTRSVVGQFSSPFLLSEIQVPRNNMAEVFYWLQAQPKGTGD